MSTPVRRALYGKLAGDTTLNALLGTPATGYSHSIYFDEAPQIAGYPLVIFSRSSGVPTDTFGTPGAYETDVWLVKAVDRSSTADTVEAIAARVQSLLNDASAHKTRSFLIPLRKVRTRSLRVAFCNAPSARPLTARKCAGSTLKLSITGASPLQASL